MRAKLSPGDLAAALNERRNHTDGGRRMAADLNNRHRDTLERIFRHPSSGNIEWRQVLSLLETIGTTTEERNGKVKVTLGPETEVLQPPRGKDVDQQTIVDLRRMLTRAGFAPGDVAATEMGTGTTTATASGDAPA
jgi:hypothetical protein